MAINRRDMLKWTGGAMAAGLIAQAQRGVQAASAEDAQKPLPQRIERLGMQGARAMEATLAQEIRIIAEHGYGCIELRDWKLQAFLRERSLDDLKGLLSAANVKPLNLSCIELKTFGDNPERDKLREEHAWYFRNAKAIGCRSAMFVHFKLGSDDLSHAERVKRGAEDMRYFADLAAEHDLHVLYEFLGSRSLPIYNVEQTMEAMARADRKNLGWIFDFYHYQVTDRDLAVLSKADFSTLGVVHICDVKDLPYEQIAVPNSQRNFPGLGVCQFAEVLDVFEKNHYAGAYVLELYNPDFLSMDPVQFAQKGRESVAAVCGTRLA